MQASNNGEETDPPCAGCREKDIGQHRMQLENIDLTIFAEEVIDSFRPMAARKDIRLHTEMPGKNFTC